MVKIDADLQVVAAVQLLNADQAEVGQVQVRDLGQLQRGDLVHQGNGDRPSAVNVVGMEFVEVLGRFQDGCIVRTVENRSKIGFGTILGRLRTTQNQFKL